MNWNIPEELLKAKIGILQFAPIPGRPDLNTMRIIKEIGKARRKGVHILVLPEMAVPGYLIGDLWEFDEFVRDVEKYNDAIKDASKDIIVIWGSVTVDETEVGEDSRLRKFNSILIAQNGEWCSNGVSEELTRRGIAHNPHIFEGRIHKTLLPKYRMFDDERHFFSSIKLAHTLGVEVDVLLQPFTVLLFGLLFKLGLLGCEDAWNSPEDQSYHDFPWDSQYNAGADMFIDISTSPWTWRKNAARHRVIRRILKKCPLPLIYANVVGLQNNGKNIFMFDGSSCAYMPDGSIHMEVPAYKETLATFSFGIPHKWKAKREVKTAKAQELRDSHELFDALVYGLYHSYRNAGVKRALVGLSGGIDSAVVAALVRFAGLELFTVNMPSVFNKSETIQDAELIARNLGALHAVIPIQESVEHKLSQVGNCTFAKLGDTDFSPIYKDMATVDSVTTVMTDFHLQNIQARERGAGLLAALAAVLGALLTNNGNKLEGMVGYTTMYGDLIGFLGALLDLWKMEVYQIADYINLRARRDVIPQSVRDRAPSAELAKDQEDPFYFPYHDKLGKALMEFRLSPADILQYYAEGCLEEMIKAPAGVVATLFPTAAEFIADLERIYEAESASVFKRVQAPPIFAVSKRAYGYDNRQFLHVAKPYYSARYIELKNILLQM